jgi:hypothetical protein
VLSRAYEYVRIHHVGLLALLVALGGTSYAAIKLPTGSVGTRQLKANAVTGSKVMDGTLTKKDFAAGEFVAGAPGSKGDRGDKGDAGGKGDTGEKGDTGTVDTSNFYDKVASDSRFLGLHGKSDDADLLDGLNANGFIQGEGRMLFVRKTFETANATPILTVPGWGTFRAYGDASMDFHRHDFLNQSGEALSVFVDDGGPDPIWYVLNNNISVSSPAATFTDIIHWMIVRQVDDATQVLNADVASADEGATFEIIVEAVAQP